MAEKTILIIGGALSGPTAAARARETDENARIILLERNQDISYAVGGLAYHLSGEVKSLAALNQERADYFRDVYRVEARTGVSVTKIDAAAKTVQANGATLNYDSLIFAAGAESILPDAPGLADARNVFRFRTLGDLKAIVARLKKRAKRVAVIGGGFFGVEAADGFLRRKCKVTILERNARILPQFTPCFSSLAASALKAEGAAIVTDVQVTGADRKGGDVTALQLSNGKKLPVDIVIAAIGLTPRTQLLRDAGAQLLADGTVRIDEHCATTLPGVYACGVCVALHHAVNGRQVWLPQAAQADKTAQVAGTNAAGGAAIVRSVLGTAIVRAGNLAVARTGLTGEDARDAAVARVHALSHDAYFPGAKDTTINLYFEKTSGRILGGEIASESGADKRIDVLATAIDAGLNVAQLANIDLAYAPPYSAARDPLNVAGTVAVAMQRGQAKAWSAADTHQKADGVVLVDVRTDAERKRAPVDKAVAVPMPVLRKKLAQLPSEKPVVFVSATGRAGYLAARIASALGRQEAAFVSGGMRSWVAEGVPLAKKKGGKS